MNTKHPIRSSSRDQCGCTSELILGDSPSIWFLERLLMYYQPTSIGSLQYGCDPKMYLSSRFLNYDFCSLQRVNTIKVRDF